MLRLYEHLASSDCAKARKVEILESHFAQEDFLAGGRCTVAGANRTYARS